MKDRPDPEVLVPVVTCEDGKVVCVPDDREDEYAICAPVEDGQPLNGGDMYSRREDGRYQRVDLGSKGPSKVTTPAYRAGWERTFNAALN